MSNSINTNVGAQIALQTLNATNAALTNTQNRISTGLKVADAKDDSAVYSIAQTLRSQNSALDQVTASLNRGVSTLGVANTAGTAISDLLTQAQSAVLAASDKSLDAQSRAAYQQKYNSLATQITTYIKNASFNGVNLLDGSTQTYSALANSDGTQNISVAGQNLSLSTGYSGGTVGVPATLTAPGAPAIAATALTQDSAFTVSVDGGTAVTVNLYANGGANHDGKYSAADIAAAINNTPGLAGVASTVGSTLSLASTTGGTGSSVTLGVPATGNGDFTNVGTLQTKLGGFTAATAAGTGATSTFTETGGGGLILISGNEQFTATTNYADLITKLKASIANVSTALGSLGASANALTNHLTFISKLQDSLTTGIGNLVDADVAKESANLTALQTKQQLGVQALSIANSAPQAILALFKG